MAFDVKAARSAGYTDDEIAGYLADSSKFDLNAARSAGYTPSEIVDFLSNQVASPAPAPPVAQAANTPTTQQQEQDLSRPAGVLRRDITPPAAQPAATVRPGREAVPDMSVGSVAQDALSGALQIGPVAVKGVADLARLATGDRVGKDASDYLERGMQSIRDTVGSERAAVQRRNFDRDMADPNVSIGQALSENKGALADQILPTVGSMILPVGAAGLAGKAATAGRAAQVARAIDEGTVLARADAARRAAVVGTTVAQNAADTYTDIRDKGGDQSSAYTGAAITAPFTAVAGKLTGGAAETQVARMLSSTATRELAEKGLMAIPAAAIREGAQEIGEEAGQYLGESVGTGTPLDADTAGKRLAVAGTLGAVVGGGVSGVDVTSSAIRQRQEQSLQAIGSASNVDEAIAAAADSVATPTAPSAPAQTAGQSTAVDQAIAQAAADTAASAQPASTQQLIDRIRELEAAQEQSIPAQQSEPANATGNGPVASDQISTSQPASVTAGSEADAVVPEQRTADIPAERMESVREGVRTTDTAPDAQPSLTQASAVPQEEPLSNFRPSSQWLAERSRQRVQQAVEAAAVNGSLEAASANAAKSVTAAQSSDGPQGDPSFIQGPADVAAPTAMQEAFANARPLRARRSAQTAAPSPSRLGSDASSAPVQQVAASSAPAFTAALEPSGTLRITGNAQQIRQQLADFGVDKFIPARGGVVVAKSQAARAQSALSAMRSTEPSGQVVNAQQPASAGAGVRFSNDGTNTNADRATAELPLAGSEGSIAGLRSASADHAAAARRLADRPQLRIPGLSFRAVDPAPGNAGQEMNAARLVAKRLFRRDVVFVKFDGKPLFNGVVSSAIPGKVFINAESTKPHMAVLGHELLHEMRADNPRLYDSLSRSLDAIIRADSKYASDLAARYEALGLTLPKEWREELHADIVGDHFTDPQFWQDLAVEQPSLFQRVAQSIRQFLNRVLAKARPFGTDRFLSDVEAARQAVTSAMREFSQDQVRSVGREVDGVVAEPSVANDSPESSSASQDVSFSAADLSQSAEWQLPEMTRTDRFIYETQDGRIDLKRTQEAIRAAGREIEERFDARTAETLYAGRVAYRAEQFLKADVKPLLQAMTLSKVGMDELADYLHARGAEERNAQIAKVNPELPDGGAGMNSKGVLMTNGAAREYLAAVPKEKRVVLDALAKRVDAITKGTRELLVDEGLEKREVVDAWEATYKNYVPMFRDEAESGSPAGSGGGGFNVRGSNSQRATGSTKQVTNILAHVLMQREAAITRAEKNRVGMALYGLALTNPNRDVWTTIRPGMQAAQIAEDLEAMGVDPAVAEMGMSGVPTVRGIDPVTNKVLDRPNPMYKNLPGAIILKVAGEDRVLMLNEKNERALRMAQSLKNLDGLTNFDLAGSIVGRTTRWLAAVNTQFNPAFGLVNGIRDTFGGAINLTSTPLKGKSAKVLMDAYLHAGRGIAQWLMGNKSSPWAKIYEQFQEDGGQTGYREAFRTAEDRTKAIEKEMLQLSESGRMTAMKAVTFIPRLLDGFNTTIENAVRLSAYKNALDSGMSRPAAAKLARELTVDFNRKGRLGREVGPLYAFFNASVQGSARTIEALKGPTGAKIIAGGLALGVAQAIMLAMAGYEEDEVPEFIKARAFIIPVQGKEKNYIAIPLPLGLHVLPNTGRVITDLALSGGKEAGKKSFNAVGEIAGAFSPLGGGNIFTADGALRTALPTIIDPVVEIGFNKNFAGGQISKEPRGESDVRPGFARVKESTQRSVTGQAYIGISKALNSVSGGTEYEAGLASPTPEQVQYIAQVAGGGLLREIEKSINLSGAAARGDKVPQSKIPVLGRLWGEVDNDAVDKSRYFESSKAILKAKAAERAAAKAGDADAVQKLYADRPELKAAYTQDQISRAIANLNRLAVSPANDPEQFRQLDEARLLQMRALNKVIKTIEDSEGKDTPRKKLRRLVSKEPQESETP